MDSQSWDFEIALNLLESLKPPDLLGKEARRHRSTLSPPRIPSPSGFDPKVDEPQNLGDFNRLYEFLGLATQDFTARPRNQSIESSAIDDASQEQESTHSTPPSSIPDTISLDAYVDHNRKVRWEDEIAGSDIPTVNSRSSVRRRSSRSSLQIRNTADFDSETEAETSTRYPDLVPSWVTPKPQLQPNLKFSPIPDYYIDPTVITPLDTLTATEKRAKLLQKLRKSVGFGSEITQPAKPLHIFVDCSNIIIGFYNTLKVKRGLHEKSYTRQPPLSWRSLATILERGRTVARRIVVGSHGSPHKPLTKFPEYLAEAESLGYELNVLDRVYKYKDPSQTLKKYKKGGGNGYATSGQSSGSEGIPMGLKVVAEQGVDEILHMKMLESLVDTAGPGIIVLASGDAAEAEYSGGFFKNVERALKRGWKVELVSWSAGLSREYQAPAFLKKWHEKFTIIKLDDFSEELLALYTLPYTSTGIC